MDAETSQKVNSSCTNQQLMRISPSSSSELAWFFNFSSFPFFSFFLCFPLILHFNFSSFTPLIFQKTHYSWSFSFYSFYSDYIFFRIIVIPNPTQHPSLVLLHFAIFLTFLTVVINFTFSHIMPCSYPLISLFLLYIILQKHSSFLSQVTSFPPFWESYFLSIIINCG